MQQSTNEPHERYLFLDALRGVAAIFVVFYHIGARFGGGNFVAHGYLAVDFFFVLSGFVIAASYEQRLGHAMSFTEFARRRFIRLLPMSALGVSLGTAYLLVRWVVAKDWPVSLGELLSTSVLNLLLVPKFWISPGLGDKLFPGDGPLWSLFFEVTINLIWAAFLVRWSSRALLGAALVGAVLITITALRSGTADLGWGVHSFAGGMGRVLYGFIFGVLIFRFKHRLSLKSPAAPWLALMLLSVAILVPINSLWWVLPNMLIALPAAVVLGLSAGRSGTVYGADLLGRISYPLYAIHMPLLLLASGVPKLLFPETNALIFVGPLFIIIALIAYFALVAFDEPLRQRLQRHVKRQPAIACADCAS